MARVKFMCKDCCKVKTKPQGSDRRSCYTCVPRTPEDDFLELRANKPQAPFTPTPFESLGARLGLEAFTGVRL